LNDGSQLKGENTMGWKFWQGNDKKEASKIKLPGPREVPEKIGRYLVVNEKMDPDYVWALKCVQKPHSQSNASYDFRVFSDNSAQKAGVAIANYDTLDAHAELILFHGRIDKRTEQMEIHKGG